MVDFIKWLARTPDATTLLFLFRTHGYLKLIPIDDIDRMLFDPNDTVLLAGLLTYANCGAAILSPASFSEVEPIILEEGSARIVQLNPRLGNQFMAEAHQARFPEACETLVNCFTAL